MTHRPLETSSSEKDSQHTSDCKTILLFHPGGSNVAENATIKDVYRGVNKDGRHNVSGDFYLAAQTKFKKR